MMPANSMVKTPVARIQRRFERMVCCVMWIVLSFIFDQEGFIISCRFEKIKRKRTICCFFVKSMLDKIFQKEYSKDRMNDSKECISWN